MNIEKLIFRNINKQKKVDKWVPSCCKVVVEDVIVMDVSVIIFELCNEQPLHTKNDSERRHSVILS